MTRIENQAREFNFHVEESKKQQVQQSNNKQITRKPMSLLALKNRNNSCGMMKVFQLFSHVQLFAPMDSSPPGFSTPGILQAEYWSGQPFPSPGDLPDPGIEPRSPELQADSSPSEPLGKPYNESGQS